MYYSWFDRGDGLSGAWRKSGGPAHKNGIAIFHLIILHLWRFGVVTSPSHRTTSLLHAERRQVLQNITLPYGYHHCRGLLLLVLLLNFSVSLISVLKIPLAVVEVLLYATITYWMSGLNKSYDGAHYFIFLGLMLLPYGNSVKAKTP